MRSMSSVDVYMPNNPTPPDSGVVSSRVGHISLDPPHPSALDSLGHVPPARKKWDTSLDKKLGSAKAEAIVSWWHFSLLALCCQTILAAPDHGPVQAQRSTAVLRSCIIVSCHELVEPKGTVRYRRAAAALARFDMPLLPSYLPPSLELFSMPPLSSGLGKEVLRQVR